MANNTQQSKTWISNGVETLFKKHADNNSEITFDTLIVGSGYGAAVAASELSGRRNSDGSLHSVCVLERGKEFVPGSFPSCASEIPAELRYTMPDGKKASGELDGLFDIRIGTDLSIVQANGLGGGSLINAGVLERPDDSVFKRNWPQEISSISKLEKYYEVAEKKLGVLNDNGKENTIEDHAKFDSIKKYKSLEKLAPNGIVKPARVSIAMSDDFRTSANVALDACVLCGNCVTGCNHNSKNSLDVNLLRIAHLQGAEIYTGATVMKLEKKISIISEKEETTWLVHINYTQADLRKRNGDPIVIEVGNVIIAAGSLGSTELLKRSQELGKLQFSKMLGHRFSSNADMVVTGFNQRKEVNAFAYTDKPTDEKLIGPSITGIADNRSSNGVLIEEMAVPKAISQLTGELITTMSTIHSVGKVDWSFHSSKKEAVDPIGVNQKKLNYTSIYAAMGDDGAEGVLDHTVADAQSEEGTIQVQWGTLREHPIFVKQLSLIEKWSKRLFSIKGKVLPNLIWQPLPKALMFLTGDQKGPCLTVHPLGGCCMADDVTNGVVDHAGRVFDGILSSEDQNIFHDGLYILDGSVISSALSINPALTISALAFRSIEMLIDSMQLVSDSEFTGGESSRPSLVKSSSQKKAKQETEFQMIERMSGEALIRDDVGQLKEVVIELSIKTIPKPFGLVSKPEKPETKINADYLDIMQTSSQTGSSNALSQIRIFEKHKWMKLRRSNKSDRNFEKKLSEAAVFIAPIKGRIHVFGREKSNVIQRIYRATFAWLKNRGLRDTLQDRFPKRYEPKSKGKRWARVKMTLGGLSHAGECRTIKYDVSILKSSKSLDFNYFANNTLSGTKRFIYSRKSNPWKQLSELAITAFPKKSKQDKHKPVLSLDTTYLTSRGIPLLHITKQTNHVDSLLDLASAGLYIARLMFLIHFWSFRKPDAVPPKIINRFANKAQGLPTPTIHTIKVDTIADDEPEYGFKKGQDTHIRLTHYSHPNPINIPILMIHGWGASSTTFAHHSIDNGLASYMYANQRDIWLVDLRTSSAMPTARYPWSFENIAECDIPHAINFIVNQYEAENQKIDIIAHCMGAVMLSMSILGPDKLGWDEKDKTFYQKRINKIVMSQATPALILTPDNSFKEFMASYISEILPKNYEFRPTAKNQTLADELTDRLLSSLPYPSIEFDRINPFPKFWKRVHYTRTRQRMDAIYGRSFNLPEVSDQVLEHIDDLFGPLNLSLSNQIAHFARNKTVTNRDGKNVYLTRLNLKNKWSFETFSIHSENNGVIDFSTADRSQKIFDEAGCKYTSLVIKDDKFGHQDTIIGENAHREIYPHFQEFLSKNEYIPIPHLNTTPRYQRTATATTDSGFHNFQLEPPVSGPIIHLESQESDFIKVGFGTNDAFGESPYPSLLLPVAKNQATGRFLAIGDGEDEQQDKIRGVVTEWVNRMNNPEPPNRLFDDPHFARWIVEPFPKSAFQREKNKVGCLLIVIYDASPLVNMRAMSNDMQPQNKTDSAHELKKMIDELCAQVNTLLKDEDNSPHYLKKGLIEYVAETKEGDENKTTTFAFSSCQYPNGIFDEEISTDSFRKLNHRIKSETQPPIDFVALVGDQVYTDPTAGLLDPTRKYDKYSAPYIRLYQANAIRNVLRKVPVFNMLDDHEIENNWEPCSDTQPTSSAFEAGIDSFLTYQRGIKNSGQVAPNKSNRLWYKFKHNDHHFFMMDTRTERKHRTAANIIQKDTTIVSSEQMSELTDWLAQSPPNSLKFILSGALFLPRHQLKGGSLEKIEHALHSDSWDGYPSSLHLLLGHIAENQIENVVFLSGDEHMGCFAQATIKNQKKATSTKIYSIHTPGLYTPFPFANASRDDIEGEQNINQPDIWSSEFEFISNNTNYHCTVNTQFELEELSQEHGEILNRINIKLAGGFVILSVVEV